jgi:hypothetical protein
MESGMKRAALLMIMAIAMGALAYGSGTDEQEPRAVRDAGSFSGIESVTIDAGAFDVEVSASDGPSVSLRSDTPQDSFFDAPGARVVSQRAGSRLRIQVTRESFGSGSGRLRLRVPRGMDLQIKTRSGKITVEGLVNDVCALTTMSGRVTMRDTRGDISVDSVSGDVVLDGLAGRLRVKNVSGSIRGRGVLFSEDSELSTVSGNIEIKLDNPTDELRFDLSSVSGRIVIGSIRAERGLRMGFGDTMVRGHTVSGSLVFKE